MCIEYMLSASSTCMLMNFDCNYITHQKESSHFTRSPKWIFGICTPAHPLSYALMLKLYRGRIHLALVTFERFAAKGTKYLKRREKG